MMMIEQRITTTVSTNKLKLEVSEVGKRKQTTRGIFPLEQQSLIAWFGLEGVESNQKKSKNRGGI